MKCSTRCEQPVTVLRAPCGVCLAYLGDRRVEAMNLDMMKEILRRAGVESRTINVVSGQLHWHGPRPQRRQCSNRSLRRLQDRIADPI